MDYTGLSANPYSNNSSIGYRKGLIGPVIDLFDSFVDATGQHLADSVVDQRGVAALLDADDPFVDRLRLQ